MTKRGRTRAKDPARPIRTKRDHEGAAAVAKTMSGQADRDSAAELRLQSLLRKLDEFDESEDHARADFPEDQEYLGPRRRWSDD
ncbi:MAG: hypothetical protein OEP48_07465 [Betaproteobacteria bacterium]|nr:hypothetical protein [Betaproteobacteria bacterium]MDH3435390.1 hypothetical protein [Betaproteobacteria bacterium]